ncbi:MAG TPA: S8 family peptidase [Mesotoga infera]|nr:S8 family peptidase [Mesotoga infera]HRV01536.1 S8 family peptidase [Mesotoga sp.]
MKRKLLFFASVAALLMLLLTGCPNGPKSFTLTITTSPDTGLQITINFVNQQTPFSQKYAEGTNVNVQVTSPQEKDGSAFVVGNDTKYTFQQWNDSNNNNPRDFTVNGNFSYTAQMNVQYKVDVSSNPVGAAVTGGGWYNKDTNATLTAPAMAGYIFDHWVVNGANVGNANPLNISVNEPKNVVAHYVSAQFTLTVTTTPDTGLVIRIAGVQYNSPKTVSVSEGSVVQISVDTPQERDGSAFVVGNDTRYTFQQWNDASNTNPRNVTVNGNVTYTAQMNVQYKVDVSSNPVGAAVTGGGWYNKDTNATLTAPAMAGYIFDHWVVNGANVGNANPLNISVNEPKNVVAQYNADIQYTLTVTTLPDIALDVRIDGTTYPSPKSMVVQGGSNKQIAVVAYQEKDVSPWMTGIDSKYTFANWNDGSAQNPRNVTIDSDKTFTANMTTEYRIDVSASPTLWETGTYWTPRGAVWQFDFSGDLGPYNFSYWLVNGQNVGSARPLELTIDRPHQVTAVFALQEPDYTLTVTTSPHTNLNISIGGTPYTSPKSVVLVSGTATQIAVTSPQSKDTSGQVAGDDTRYTFQQWNDLNTQNPRNITVYSDITYTAQMKLEYLVATSSNPVGTAIAGAGWHIVGEIVNFSAPQKAGFNFSHWVVNGVNAGSANPLAVTIDAPKNVVAHYVAAAGRNIWGNVTPYTGDVKTADLDEYEIVSNPDIRTVPEEAEYVEGEYILKVDSFKDAESSFKTATTGSIEILRRIESADGSLRFLLVSTDLSMKELENLTGVVNVSRNYLFYPLATTPNDTYYPVQWNYPLINLPQAWDYTVGSRSVVVAIIDSGFSVNHPDLTGVFTAGYNFIDNNTNVSEPNTSEDSHGTHVAGTVAALSNNAQGVAGVTWGGFGISIIPIRGIKDSSTLISSLIYAVDHGAKIINMSLGGPAGTEPLHDAIKYADRNGVVMVAASGNNGDGNILYPAKYPETIAVGAVWKDGSTVKRSNYSCFGPELDVVAPGGWMTSYTDPNGIYSTGWTPAGNNYMYMQGTSMATPHVTGLVALLMGAGLTDPDEIRQTLRDTATDLGTGGRDDYYGYGLVNAQAALDSITTPQEFKVFLRNPATGVDIANTTISDSGSYGFSNVTLSQVKVWAWRDMDDSGTINKGDLLGYYNYNGGKPNINNATTYNLSTGDNWIDFKFAPIVEN